MDTKVMKNLECRCFFTSLTKVGENLKFQNTDFLTKLLKVKATLDWCKDTHLSESIILYSWEKLLKRTQNLLRKKGSIFSEAYGLILMSQTVKLKLDSIMVKNLSFEHKG